MPTLDQAITSLQQQMNISGEKRRYISAAFQREMGKGLVGEKSSLKMLPSYFTNPSGQEKGIFLSLDLGGTNGRVYLLELLGAGDFKIREALAFPLKGYDQKSAGFYDFTAPSATGEDMFDFIVGKLKEIIRQDIVYSLGLTFSYPCNQEGPDHAVLLSWTKEIKTAGVVGRNVGQILTAALRKQQVNNVTLQAIINDTVAVQLAGAYGQPDCRIGSIIGTGHNSCYLETTGNYLAKPAIVNIEAGNFDKLPFTMYDQELDMHSNQPGVQLMEKMVSGKYLGELVRLIVLRFSEEGLLFKSFFSQLSTPGIFSTQDISKVLGDNTKELKTINKLLIQQMGITTSAYEERLGVYKICHAVQKRAASLVAASYLGILDRIDCSYGSHVIAVDGSLYNKMPGYAKYLNEALGEDIKGNIGTVTVKAVQEGSALGAALAAARPKY